MPIFGLQTSLQNNANSILAASFFSRYKQLTWPMIGQAAPPSHRFVENFALLGAAPMLTAFYGSLKEEFFNSFKLQVPMSLFKTKVEVSRPDLEFDQTGRSVLNAVSRVGAMMPLVQDFSLASKVMRGNLETSMKSWFDNQSYNTTFEPGVPTYSANHTMAGATAAQSNIITSAVTYLTAAALMAAPVATVVDMLQRDLSVIMDRIASWTNDKGVQIYPNFDASKNLVLVFPPCYRQVVQTAFKTGNVVIGGTQASGSGVSGSTTNVANTLVRDAFTWNLLRGCVDPYDISGSTISPSNATNYHWFIIDEFVRPAYWMPFVPLPGSDVIPKGYDVFGEAERQLAAFGDAGVTPEAAEAYASAMVDHNLGAIGANAQDSVVNKEKFFISPRMYGQWVLGPWFTQGKTVPKDGVSS